MLNIYFLILAYRRNRKSINDLSRKLSSRRDCDEGPNTTTEPSEIQNNEGNMGQIDVEGQPQIKQVQSMEKF